MAEPIAEYTVSNFSAVDNQIDQIAQRERVVTQKLWLANLFQVIKFGIISLAAPAVFYFTSHRIPYCVPSRKNHDQRYCRQAEAQNLDTVQTAPVSEFGARLITFPTPGTLERKRNDSQGENKDPLSEKKWDNLH